MKKNTKKETTNVPTAQQIAAEIKNLKGLIAKIPKKTFFGDDNHERVEIQIEVLEQRIPVESCPDKYLYADCVEGEEPSDKAFGNEDAAREAAKWLEGEANTVAPSKDWLHLVKA